MRWAALAMLTAVMLGCGDPCDHRIVKELVAPNREYKAVLYFRECGATSPDYTEISIVDANTKDVSGPGNIFTEKNHEAVGFEWKDSKHLVVKWSSDAPQAERLYRGIAISYEPEK